MKCEVVYLGVKPQVIDEICTVVSVTKFDEFMSVIKWTNLVIIDANLCLKEDQIQLINADIQKKRIPLMLYVSGQNFEQINMNLNYTGILRTDDSDELIKQMIANVILNHRKTMELMNDSDLLELFLKYNTNYVFLKDENARVLKLSHNYNNLLGIPYSDAIGKNMMELFPSELAESMVEDDLRILNNDEAVEVVEELHGHYYKTSKFPIHREGEPPLLAGFTMDISDMKETERLLVESKNVVEKLTVTDDLLGITNRRGFLSDLTKEIHRVKRYSSTSTLIILDIDRFKSFNDTLGHFKADLFLKDLVEKVQNELRTSDVFGRLGGDEFGIVCVSTPLEMGLEVTKRIQEAIYNDPVTVDGVSFTYSVSIGLTEINKNQLELNWLLHRADLALYEAKKEGRNCVKAL
jgi:diguanylate cyclase (GGDEF)-like protein/PAS domain S-box-containing protein